MGWLPSAPSFLWNCRNANMSMHQTQPKRCSLDEKTSGPTITRTTQAREKQSNDPFREALSRNTTTRLWLGSLTSSYRSEMKASPTLRMGSCLVVAVLALLTTGAGASEMAAKRAPSVIYWSIRQVRFAYICFHVACRLSPAAKRAPRGVWVVCFILVRPHHSRARAER